MNDLFSQKATEWDNPIKLKMTRNFVNELLKNQHPAAIGHIIEFGCGTGLVGLQIAPLASNIFMIDNSPSMLAQLEAKTREIKLRNIIIIPGELSDYAAEPVDTIIGFMVLHHIKNIDRLLDDAYIRLRTGGMLIIGDLVTEDGSFHNDPEIPHFGFDVQKLSETFQGTGFKNIQVKVYDTVLKNSRSYPLFIISAQK